MDGFVQRSAAARAEHLDALLAAAQNAVDWRTLDVVTWRGVVRKMLCSPFAEEGWSLFGEARNGIIYMEEDKEEPEQLARRDKSLIYGGFKFEELCMVQADAGVVPMAARQEAVVNNNCEFGIAIRARLGEHRLLMGAEVDGLDEDGAAYVELKTTRLLRNAHMQRVFEEKKLLQWWLQCFLADVPNILAGFRDEQGWVRELQRIATCSIPRSVRGRVRWDPQAVLAFGDVLLAWLRESIAAHLAATGGQSATFRLALDCAPPAPKITLVFDPAVARIVPPWFTADQPETAASAE